MLINFSLQNFGSIKNKQTLSFEADNSTHLEDYYVIQEGKFRLLKIGLIYGANASGKTTILNALEFLRTLVLTPQEKKTDLLEFKPFLFDTVTPNQSSMMSINFLQNKTRYFYEVEFNTKSILREELNFYNPKKSNIFKRYTNVDKQLTEISFGNKIKIDKIAEKTLEANTIWNNTVFGGFLKTNIEVKELKESIQWFEEYLRPPIYTHIKLNRYITSKIDRLEINKTDVINILKKADFNISDILIEKKEEDITDDLLSLIEKTSIPIDTLNKLKDENKITAISLEIEHTVKDNKYPLPFTDESQGTQRYYGFAGILALLLKKPSLFPIDELESSLHPDLFEHFLLSFLVNSRYSQIIATTHNREILNNREMFRNDAIWITNKTDEESTELYSLTDFDSQTIRNTNNIYNAYKIGKLGGVPNLGDYYIDIAHEEEETR